VLNDHLFVPKPDVIARAKADLEEGYTYRATHRLRTYLANNPHNLEIRELLADIYRQSGNPVEAGRWSYLAQEVRPEELAAFERANPSPWLRLRLLHFSADPAILPPAAQDRLRILTVQAERIGPPPIWRGPVEPDDRPERSGTALPCLFVAIVLAVVGALVGIGVYRAVMWAIHF
jgi:hypothetical protein